MDQYLVEGALGHPKATRVLDTAYVRPTHYRTNTINDIQPDPLQLDQYNDLSIFDLN